MLRDKNLIPLSRQHQHALALCVRIERSVISEEDLVPWQAEIVQHFQNEIRIHFAAEEQILFPSARKFAELSALIEDLLGDHEALREYFRKAEAQEMSADDLKDFSKRMPEHIRKEERQLFERLQALLSSAELEDLGRKLEPALKDAVEVCIVPTKATLLRPSE